MATLLDAILERGKHDGRVRRETSIADIVFPVIRFSRPVTVGLPRDDERALAHRHLDIYIDGLGADATTHPLPAPPVSSRSTR
jgi:hypothetical protein